MLNRENLIAEILAYKELAERYAPNAIDTYEDIMMQYGASDDDSDPIEGYFVTMSDRELLGALRALSIFVWEDGIHPILQDAKESLLTILLDINGIADEIPDAIEEYDVDKLEMLDELDSGLQRCIDIIDGEI